MAKHLYPGRYFQSIVWVICLALLGCSGGMQSDPAASQASAAQEFDPANSIYDYQVENILGRPIPLSRYRGKVLLVVNVASECRYTPQYENLQRLYRKYMDQGFVVLGFPSNDFGGQEPGSNTEIRDFTTRQYGVLFPLFSKISVKGEDTHPLYQCLTDPETSGKFAGPVTWNFNKFLINKEGKIVGRFPSPVDPLDPQIIEAIEAALQ